jgi:surface polysaccharide O-acyltransferase-like enzyme
MAVFSDENNQLYIGIFHRKRDELYSGSFLKISNGNFDLMQKCNRILIYLIMLLMFAIICVFSYGLKFGSSDVTENIFESISFILDCVAIFYIALGPILLSRNRVELARRKLTCLSKPSMGIYLLVFLFASAMSLDIFLADQFNSKSHIVFLLFTLIPIIGISGWAIRFYSKR